MGKKILGLSMIIIVFLAIFVGIVYSMVLNGMTLNVAFITVLFDFVIATILAIIVIVGVGLLIN